MNVIGAHPARGRKRHEHAAVPGELANDLKTKRDSDPPPAPALVDIGPLVAVTNGWNRLSGGRWAHVSVALATASCMVRDHPKVTALGDGSRHDSLIHAVNGRGPLV
ncbi:MAG: hypothetical protein ABI776_07155 [Nocardioidaceae bacterium]